MDQYKEVEHKARYIPVDKLKLLKNTPRTILKIIHREAFNG